MHPSKSQPNLVRCRGAVEVVLGLYVHVRIFRSSLFSGFQLLYSRSLFQGGSTCYLVSYSTT